MDFAVRNLAFLILLSIRRAVEIVKEDPEYMNRMTDGKNEFYAYVRKRIHESLPNESQYVPDPVDTLDSSTPKSSEFSDAVASPRGSQN